MGLHKKRSASVEFTREKSCLSIDIGAFTAEDTSRKRQRSRDSSSPNRFRSPIVQNKLFANSLRDSPNRATLSTGRNSKWKRKQKYLSKNHKKVCSRLFEANPYDNTNREVNIEIIDTHAKDEFIEEK